MKKKDEIIAIFWCSLLHPVIFDEVKPDETHQYLQKLSEKECLFPNGEMKKPSISTLQRKLKAYKEGGIEALARKTRSDRGKIRSVAQEIIDKAVEIKLDQPKRSDRTINSFLETYFKKQIPRSTLYRHLKKNGATRLKLDVLKTKVRCRWTRDTPNDLWVGDFADGPYVFVGGKTYQTHISLFIDCHSRYVVEGRYYLRESLDILIDSLLRAWAIHGASNDLYLDNAKIYHANALKAACYSIRTRLIYRTVGDPAPGGLVERMFGSAQEQFETEVRAGEILTLDKLNRAFSAWLHTMYHEIKHTETKEKPRERYQKDLVKRRVDMEKAICFFMKSEKRTVHRDFSDVSISSRFYKTDRKLRGDRVIVKYDPYSDLSKVYIYSLDEVYLCTAHLYNREKSDDVKHEPKPQGKPKHNFIDHVIEKHEKQLDEQVKGIDYTKLLNHKQWPFTAFIQDLAVLMGRKGGISAFNTDELETLSKIYDRNPDLTKHKLIKAFEKAELKNIAHVAHQLQRL